VRNEPISHIHIRNCIVERVGAGGVIAGGRCGSPQGATYAYSAMFMVVVKAGVLLPSSPEHHTVGRQYPGNSEAMQTAAETGRATRSDGDDGRAGPGYPVAGYESEHISPWASRLNSNVQPWIVLDGEGLGRETSDK
jgi:hypothetical protein